jgi:SAM-dependent methyltransferase
LFFREIVAGSKVESPVQTPAEKYLVEVLVRALGCKGREGGTPRRILNIGAGRSVSIEDQLSDAGCEYVCDRADVEDCSVDHPYVNKCFRCSAEDMSQVSSNEYPVAFANYVLEHVPDLERASREIYRILEPSGIFVATIPNPSAPQIRLAKITPLWFHRMIRGGEAWETYYGYNSVEELTGVFETAGFRKVEARYYAFAEDYLIKVPILGLLGRVCDGIVNALRVYGLMGHICVVFEKPS